MALGESELRRIGDYVRGNLSAWLSDVAPLATVGPQFLERTVRVEEELKNLRETMEVRFAAVDRRFEAQLAVMKAGFDASINSVLALRAGEWWRASALRREPATTPTPGRPARAFRSR